MRRFVILLLMLLFICQFQTTFAVDSLKVEVFMESPTNSATVDAGGNLIGRVKFFISGEGKSSIWGRFVIDNVEGPSFYQSIETPMTNPIIFQTLLPTYFGGSHEVYFELLQPNHFKTKSAFYIVNVPQKERVRITNPTNGQVFKIGQQTDASAEVMISGWTLFTLQGTWVIDGVRTNFTQKANVAGEALIKLTTPLLTSNSGDHTIKLELAEPFQEASKQISYKVSEGDGPIVITIEPIVDSATITIGTPQKIKIKVNVKGSGTFNLKGFLLVDGMITSTLDVIVTGPGDFKYEIPLPTQTMGVHTIKFKLIEPQLVESNIETYFVVGETWIWPSITYPADGTTVLQGSPLIAELAIRVGGKGTQKVVGVWMIDGNPWHDYEQMLVITSETTLLETMSLPTDAPGWHKLKFRMTWPYYAQSKEIWYRVWGREQPPSFIEILAIPQPPYPQNETFQLRIMANDDRGIKTAHVYLDSTKVLEADMGGIMKIDYVTSPIGPVPAGDHTWRVVLVDLDGLDADYIGRFVVTSGRGTLEGVILEALTNRPLEGATVTCAGRVTIADAYGKYRIENLGLGEQTVSASLKDHRSAEARVLVMGGLVTYAPTLYLGEKGPDPIIYQIENYPSVVKPGQSFILNLYIRNDGKIADWSEVAISCPDGAIIEIDPETGAQYPSFSHVFLPGSYIDHRDGQLIRAMHPVVIIRWNTWGTGVVHKVMLKVTVLEAKKFEFWTRATMGQGGFKENYPSFSATLDQQGWSILKYSVDVISP